MDYLLQIIGGSVVTGLGVFLLFFRKKNKQTEQTEVFQKVENPDKYKTYTPAEKVLQWEQYQQQLKKRRK